MEGPQAAGRTRGVLGAGGEPREREAPPGLLASWLPAAASTRAPNQRADGRSEASKGGAACGPTAGRQAPRGGEAAAGTPPSQSRLLAAAPGCLPCFPGGEPQPALQPGCLWAAGGAGRRKAAATRLGSSFGDAAAPAFPPVAARHPARRQPLAAHPGKPRFLQAGWPRGRRERGAAESSGG